MWHQALRWISPRAAISRIFTVPLMLLAQVSGKFLLDQTASAAPIILEVSGFNVFPTDEILLRNNNEFSKIDTANIFKTTNDIQIWLNSRNFWQAIWNYTSKNEVHNGSIIYDRTWASWLRTSPALPLTLSIPQDINWI